MDRNYEVCLEFVFDREAGLVCDPNDPGGATNLGITIGVLGEWRNRKATTDDVRGLSRDEAAAIYRARYWHAARCEHLPDGIDLLVFDAAVNMGVQPALNLLRAQAGLGVAARLRKSKHPVVRPGRMQVDAAEAYLLAAIDGLCGPGVIAGLAGRRRAFYRSLKTFTRYGKGWLARVALAERLAMRLWATGGTGIPLTQVRAVSRHRSRAVTH